jgi:hypothetical protein
LVSHLLRCVVAREEYRHAKFERGSGLNEPRDALVAI